MSLDLFAERLDENQNLIFEFLHEEFLSFPEINCKIRFNIPFYDYKSWICYLNPRKNSCMELCFIKGKELSYYKTLLESRDRKMIAGVVIENLEVAPLEEIINCFSEAIILDESSSKKRKKKN